jgi:pyruvate dehydrogenase E2 component (dihydrolipoamide acetyltransferase)
MRSGDLSDATFTISNLGMYGVDAFVAIVTEGQAGILAIGRIVDQLMPGTDGPETRRTVTLSLSCDHRRIDGLRAARFLDGLVETIESPDTNL